MSGGKRIGEESATRDRGLLIFRAPGYGRFRTERYRAVS